MQKNIKRESDKSKNNLLILNKHNEEVYVEKNFFLEKNKIDWIIRIPESDFDYIKNKDYYVHFNLNVSNHQSWKVYWLPKILRFWYFDPETNKEKLPLICFANNLKWECLKVEEKLSYDNIPSRYFNYTLDYIKTPEDVKEHIIWRYQKSLKGYDKHQILNLWVSVTLLKMI